jgi:hypothetical protein
MLGKHSAMGRLQSGSTIVAALDIFEEHSAQALDQVLSEAAKLIEHRGSKWTAALSGIEEALSQHLALRQPPIEHVRRLADRQNMPSVNQAIEERLGGIRRRLEMRLADFRDGWTAPPPKLWKDRHPFLHAVILLLIGAAFGFAANLVTQAAAPSAEPA